MKIFIDTEFTGLHQLTHLISLGAVTEDNKTFYAECLNYESGFQTDSDEYWFRANVLPNLKMLGKERVQFTYTDYSRNGITVCGSTDRVRMEFERWIHSFSEIQIISDCYAYDWVLFNDLWGHAFNLPKKINYIPLDLSTLLYAAGIDPDINREEFSELDLENAEKHSALWDAKVIKACWERCLSIITKRQGVTHL